MFSYTDDAIVTSSPTGRHLSTVIRRPCVLMSGWAEHAEQVCKVLNELDSKAKANSLSLHMQVCGRVKRIATDQAAAIEELRSIYGDRSPISFGAVPPATEPTFASVRIAELEKQLDNATTKLTAAQMLLEQADGKVQKLETKLTEALGVRKVRVPVKSLSVLASSYGVVMHFADQKLTIESV